MQGNHGPYTFRAITVYVARNHTYTVMSSLPYTWPGTIRPGYLAREGSLPYTWPGTIRPGYLAREGHYLVVWFREGSLPYTWPGTIRQVTLHGKAHYRIRDPEPYEVTLPGKVNLVVYDQFRTGRLTYTGPE